MSSLAEIEAALASLPPEDLQRVEDVFRRLREQSLADEMARIEKENGFDPLPRRTRAVVTTEMVQQLCAEQTL